MLEKHHWDHWFQPLTQPTTNPVLQSHICTSEHFQGQWPHSGCCRSGRFCFPLPKFPHLSQTHGLHWHWRNCTASAHSITSLWEQVAASWPLGWSPVVLDAWTLSHCTHRSCSGESSLGEMLSLCAHSIFLLELLQHQPNKQGLWMITKARELLGFSMLGISSYCLEKYKKNAVDSFLQPLTYKLGN